MEYSYDFFPQLNTFMSNQTQLSTYTQCEMLSYPIDSVLDHGHSVYCQDNYTYQQQKSILESQVNFSPSTTYQQQSLVYPIYNQPYCQPQQPRNNNMYYTVAPSTSPSPVFSETYQSANDTSQHFLLPIDQRKASPRRNSLSSSMSSPSSCFSTLSSFTTEEKPTKASSLFRCEYMGCTKTFTRTYNLKSHRRTHTNEKPFACKLCPKAFARQHDCNRHEKLHSGSKPHPCKYCNKSFARQDALNRHLKRDKRSTQNKGEEDHLQPPPCLLAKLRQKQMAALKNKKKKNV
ncbi:uncharacterized protein B0P05DRAFT_562273 [Gilbertella persicaria]|uniref:uncharacterized protein n=1 Tax=Gilbertella persicaria TaxID=101096 RepID=UPI00221F5B73|nr:uncharacterized protein B0P05DRAFT_562273 [Gilbertella persicaria]KAI8051898.1 hypothetical protein B0P05DRAFT_562273 [Gilbertella persicaria]